MRAFAGDEAGTDRVRPHALRSIGQGDVFGQAGDRRLHGRIAQQRGLLRPNRIGGRVHDDPAALSDQVRDHRPAGPDRHHQVDLEVGVPVLVGDIQQGLAGLQRAGGDGQPIQPPELTSDLRHRRLDRTLDRPSPTNIRTSPPVASARARARVSPRSK